MNKLQWRNDDEEGYTQVADLPDGRKVELTHDPCRNITYLEVELRRTSPAEYEGGFHLQVEGDVGSGYTDVLLKMLAEFLVDREAKGYEDFDEWVRKMGLERFVQAGMSGESYGER